MPKLIHVDTISATSRRYGRTSTVVAEGAKADIVPGASIRLYGIHTDKWFGASNAVTREFTRVHTAVSYDHTFHVGDTVTYDSYNLTYLGTITAIGPKTVTVEEAGFGRGWGPGRAHRMSLYDFNRRNCLLDLDAIYRRNAETMMSI